VQIGQTGRRVEVPLAMVSFKELTITGGFASTPTSWDRAMRLLANGSVDLDSLATDPLPLERWQEAFDSTAKGDGVKFLLTPGSAVTEGEE
jgi:L-iditol 2-dehydrogenase